MGDMGEYFRDWKEHKRKQRELLGVDCPGCNVVQPKRIPTRLMPGQKCKVCGYQDQRRRSHADRCQEV